MSTAGRVASSVARGAVSVAVLLGLASGVRAQAGSNGPPPQLSLREAVEEALNRSPAILNARAGIEQSGLSVRLAQSPFALKILPSMTGSFGQTNLSNQTYGLNVSQKLLSGLQVSGGVNATSYRNQLGNYYFSDTTFQVTQPLLRGLGAGANGQAISQAQSMRADAGRQLSLVEGQVAQDVAVAYYGVVVQSRLLEVAGQSIERAASFSDATEALRTVGRVSQLDVLRAQQSLGQARSQQLDAEAALADARDRLCVLIGRSMDTSFAVDPVIPVETEPLTMEFAVNSALGRAEVQSAVGAVADAERAASVARVALRPEVDVGVAVTRQETATNLRSAFGTDGFQVAPFASISAPLDHTAENVEVRTAGVNLDRRRQDLQSVRDRVAEEARQSVRRQDRAVRSLALAQASVRLAEEEVSVAALRFQRGLSTSLDVTSAQSTLRTAQGQEVAAQAEVALARLAVRAATGLLDPRRDIR